MKYNAEIIALGGNLEHKFANSIRYVQFLRQKASGSKTVRMYANGLIYAASSGTAYSHWGIEYFDLHVQDAHNILETLPTAERFGVLCSLADLFTQDEYEALHEAVECFDFSDKCAAIEFTGLSEDAKLNVQRTREYLEQAPDKRSAYLAKFKAGKS